MSLKDLDTAFGTASDEAWMDVPGVEAMAILLRATSAPAVRKLQLKQARANVKIYRAKQDLSLEQIDKAAIDLLAGAIVVDWRGFTQANGEPLPCTPENVAALMGKYLALRDACISFANEQDNFRAEATEALGKTVATNSGSNSVPTGNG